MSQTTFVSTLGAPGRLLSSSAMIPAVAAVQQPTGTLADDRAQSFRPVQGGDQLQSGEKLLVEAYVAIWLIVFVMIFLSWRRQKQIDRRIDSLEAALAKARSESSDRGS